MKLFKRGKTYWLDYTANGKRHRQSTNTGNYALAVAWMNGIKTAKKMPTFEAAVEVLKMIYDKPVEGLLPIDSIWGIYTDIAKSTGKDAVEPYTMHRREGVVKRFLKWLHEKRPTVKTIENVTGPIAAGFASFLADEDLKSKTRINIISELSTVWALLEKASEGVHNPWTALTPKNTDGQRGKFFTKAQEKAVLEAAKKIGKDWHPICVIMRHTGLRYGSVARLTWEEIDGNVIRHTPIKTKRHGITVAIPMIEPVRKAVASLSRTSDFLFPLHAQWYGVNGKTAHKIICFRDVLDAAGISGEGYTIHSWRHTAATRLAESGADKETRKLILGHTQDATAERYDHAEHLNEQLEALERAR